MTLRLPLQLTLPNESALQIAATLFEPARVSEDPILLVCLPGGGMNRGYFDLQPEDGDTSFSFARQMSARGFHVLTMDHLGIGDSTRPADGYALDASLLAQANEQALQQVLGELRAHLPMLRSIGVGHSMGAMLTLLQQAQYKPHAAIALLGFSTRGLPDYTPPAQAELAKDPRRLREQLPALAQKMFREPYPKVQRDPQAKGIFGGSSADPRGIAALKAASDEPLLPLPAYQSMLPGNVALDAARVDVPVYLAVGDRDMAGPPQQIPAAFTASRDIALQVLPDTGHAHFLFAARAQLFERLAVWTRSVTAPRA
ncbi:alpha/beta hydrolase [Hydrocarboniphaga sp.]|uniref:alpha/beta hydrolase n=1 Tax=Hydrocarboniphaga sp. TaxID=2033016 RepID=UPI003D0F5EAC